jgi:hypothetical protein
MAILLRDQARFPDRSQMTGGQGNGFCIAAVSRRGPLVEVQTPGLLLAGPPAPVEVRAVGLDGGEISFTHRYRLHQAREGMAQRLAGTGPTRVLAVTVAADGTVWAVRETFAPGQCAQAGGAVAYAPAIRRQRSALPTNTVPALAVGQDGALWLGTALGLTRWHQGQFTRVQFDPEVSFQGDAATLEAFFQALAAAIFEARPVETVALGAVSFVAAFGGPLRKEDLIYSLVEEAQGTLGGGLRRVELRDGVPLRQVAVDAGGAVWLATDEGLFRLHPASLDGGGGGGGSSHGQLIAVAGNNQSALPGQALPTPLVVRLEDQFGRPVVGEPLTATLVQGDADFLSDATVTTDADGQASFRLRVKQSATDLMVEVTALALQGTRAYVATSPLPRLYIVDITTPRAATFPADTDSDGVPDVILRRIDFPEAPQDQDVRAVAVQGDYAYVLTNDAGDNPGTLQVVRIGDPATAEVVHHIDLCVPHPPAPDLCAPRPTGLAVAGDVLYVPAGTEGLLVFDLRDPARPVLAATLGDPDPRDAVTTELSSEIALANDFA